MSIDLTCHKPMLVPFTVTYKKISKDVISSKLPDAQILSIIQFLTYPELLKFDAVCPAWHYFLNNVKPWKSSIALKRSMISRTLNTEPVCSNLHSKEFLLKEISSILQNLTELPAYVKVFRNNVSLLDITKKFIKYDVQLIGTIKNYVFFHYQNCTGIFIVDKFSGTLRYNIHLPDILGSKKLMELDNKAEHKNYHLNRCHFFKIVECFILSESNFIVISKGGLISFWEKEKIKSQKDLDSESKESPVEHQKNQFENQFVCTKSHQFLPISKFCYSDSYDSYKCKTIDKAFKIGNTIFFTISKYIKDSSIIQSHTQLYSFVINDATPPPSLSIRASKFAYAAKTFTFNAYDDFFVGLIPPSVFNGSIMKFDIDQNTGDLNLDEHAYKYDHKIKFRDTSYPINYINLYSNNKYLVGYMKGTTRDGCFTRVNVWDIKTNHFITEFPSLYSKFNSLYSKYNFNYAKLQDDFFISIVGQRMDIYDIALKISFPNIFLKDVNPTKDEKIYDVIVLRTHVIVIIESTCQQMRSIIYKIGAETRKKTMMQKACLLM